MLFQIYVKDYCFTLFFYFFIYTRRYVILILKAIMLFWYLHCTLYIFFKETYNLSIWSYIRTPLRKEKSIICHYCSLVGLGGNFTFYLHFGSTKYYFCHLITRSSTISTYLLFVNSKISKYVSKRWN